jgi:Coenzyme PQQ synthesis protein D (PqqD)
MPTPSPDVVGRRLDDRFVLVNRRTNRIYELNRTASALWELLSENAEASDLEERMQERFRVEPEGLRRDIDSTMRLLADAGLVSSSA